MICITGAGGTVGREVVAELQRRGIPLRAACFSPTSAEAARARGAEVVMIDYARPDTLTSAFRGCDALFLLGPNHLDQTSLEIGAVQAARDAGIRRIVKQSVMGAAADDYSLAHVHRPVERAIEESHVDWTFLRPNSFMQNVVTFMRPTIVSQSAFYSASGDARISHVDVRDIAAVAVQALTEPGHAGRAYTLTGPEATTYDELAAALSAELGRPIAHVSLPPDDLRGGMVAEGLPEPLADRLLDLERYFREGRASAVTRDIERVTGRVARPFSEYLRDAAAQLA